MLKLLKLHLFTFTGTESKVSVGILNIKLEMYPPLNQTLSQEVVNTQVNNPEFLFFVCFYKS